MHPEMPSRKLFRSIVVVGLNIVIFYFLIGWCSENIQVAILAKQFSRIPPVPIALTIVVNLIAIGFYALRLGTLIDRPPRISLPTAFLGFGLNTVLPFRLGEIAKLYYAKRYFLIPTSRLFAATLVEKLFDLGALAALSAFLVMSTGINLIQKSFVIALIAVVVAGFAAMVGYRRFAHRIAEALGTSVRRRALITALHEQSRLHHLHRLVYYTIAIWALNILVIYAGFSGSLPDYSIGALDAVALLLISALAIAVPTAPAGVGLFEAGIVAYLTQVRGVPNELALAVAVVFHIGVSLPIFIGLAWTMLSPKRTSGDDLVKR